MANLEIIISILLTFQIVYSYQIDRVASNLIPELTFETEKFPKFSRNFNGSCDLVPKDYHYLLIGKAIWLKSVTPWSEFCLPLSLY